MIYLKYLEQPEKIPLTYLCNAKGGRRFVVSEDMFVTLSDGREILIEEGFETDLMSIPSWAWSILKPFDKGIIGDIIHDKLWVIKKEEFQHFNFNIFESRKFADEERLKWRQSLVPNLKIKNLITHKVIRWIGGFFYSKQIKIPN